MLVADLARLSREPDYRGSVQDLYRLRLDGLCCLLCRTSESGSVFDVGTFFSVPGSDITRTAVRHDLYVRLMDPGAWAGLDPASLTQCLGTGEYRDLVLGHPAYQRVRCEGARTHHLGIVDTQTGEVLPTGFPPSPSPLVLVEEYPVHKPVRFTLLGRAAWNYARYFRARAKILGLEHVFRLGAPGGSSLLARYESIATQHGSEAANDFVRSLGLREPPTPWRYFEHAIYDCAAKYESYDRHLDWQETVHLADLSPQRFTEAFVILSLCTAMTYAFFKERGFDLWDLKWELAATKDSLVVVDTIDPDSIRLTAHTHQRGRPFYIHFNKQAVRDYFRILHPEWYRALNESKRRSSVDPQGRGFMTIYRQGVAAGEFPDIPPLHPEFAELQARKYELVARRTRTGQPLHPAAGDLEEAMTRELAFYEARGKLDAFAALNASAGPSG